MHFASRHYRILQSLGISPASVVNDQLPGTGPRRSYIPWDELLRRAFGSEIVCPDCGGKLKQVAPVKTETNTWRILEAMHLPTVPPKAVSPQPPPEEEMTGV